MASKTKKAKNKSKKSSQRCAQRVMLPAREVAVEQGMHGAVDICQGAHRKEQLCSPRGFHHEMFRDDTTKLLRNASKVIGDHQNTVLGG